LKRALKRESIQNVNIRESQIEDILASYPDLLREILGCSDEITLIARQKILPSDNRIDMLLVSGRKLLLVELKAVRFDKRQIKQVSGYAEELLLLQSAGKLVAGDVIPYLLCVSFDSEDSGLCERHGIRLKRYSPEIVLTSFFERLQGLASFMALKPTNHGLWNLHLLNRVLYVLSSQQTIAELSSESGLSRSTTLSYVALASELGLVRREKHHCSLTDTGVRYVFDKDPSAPIDHISDSQAKVLQAAIVENPFGSGAILGIYTAVESVYALSKNTYPVPLEHFAEYFRQSAGRLYDWSSRKTLVDSLRMYSNYAIDLGLLGRIGDKFYITPDGVRFVLLLNLHKSIKIVDALGISRSKM
jgi:hypothetical protein